MCRTKEEMQEAYTIFGDYGLTARDKMYESGQLIYLIKHNHYFRTATHHSASAIQDYCRAENNVIPDICTIKDIIRIEIEIPDGFDIGNIIPF